MKNITKNLIVAGIILGAFAFGHSVSAQVVTVFSTKAEVAKGDVAVNGSGYASSLSAASGETVTLRAYYKNTGNWDATNTKVKLVKEVSGNTANYKAVVSADNSSYNAESDSSVSIPVGKTIDYVAGSAKWFPNQSTVSASLPYSQNGSEVFSDGLNLGVIKSKFSCPGSNPDCREGYIVLKLKVSGTITIVNPDPVKLYACQDGVDNDNDGKIDYPADPGCSDSLDNDETDALGFSATTVAANNISQTSARLNASFANASGNTVSVWFQYGTTSALGSNSNLVNVAASSNSASVDLGGLTAGTTYYFRAVVKDATSIKNASNILSFGTTSNNNNNNNNSNLPPAVYTLSASSITQTSAVVNGQVNPNGYTTTLWFEYGTSASNLNSTIGTQNIGAGQMLVSVSYPISSLQPNTDYYFRVVASNAYGTVPGQINSFRTEAVLANGPRAITSLAASVGKTSAKLNALIAIDGSASTKAYFEYGTTISLGKTTVSETVGSTGQISFNQTIAGLAPNTIYFFRAVAENSYGTNRGDVIVFKTANADIVVDNDNDNQSSNVSLKVTSNFKEVSIGDIIDLTVAYKNSGSEIKNAVLRVVLPEGMKFRKASSGSYADRENALIIDLGTLAKGKDGKVLVQVEITRKASSQEMLLVNALLTYNNSSDASKDVLAYGVLNVAKEDQNLLGAAALFGNGSFLPSSLIEWIILIVAILALVMLGREIYFRSAGSKEAVVSQASNGGMIPNGLPTDDNDDGLPGVPVSKYAGR